MNIIIQQFIGNTKWYFEGGNTNSNSYTLQYYKRVPIRLKYNLGSKWPLLWIFIHVWQILPSVIYNIM